MRDLHISHTWDRLEDLPPQVGSIARPDLDQVLQLWRQEQASLKDHTKVERLRDRLATLWAIETGVIERLYTIDRGVTETLVDLGLEALERFGTTGRITRSASKLIEDQRAALDFVFSFIKKDRALTLSYIKETHQLLLRNQEDTEAVDQFCRNFRADLVGGEWKKWPNNPTTDDGSIHEYCPPEFVQDEMETLLRLHYAHKLAAIRPEVEAAWLHHRFTQIHPFQDGNGRVARALATMVFLQAGFLPLVIRDIEHRDAYLDALASADRSDLGPLVSLFANIQIQDLENAVTFVREMRGAGISEIARSAADAARRRIQQDEDTVRQMTDHFIILSTQRLEEISYDIRRAFSESGLNLDTSVFSNSDRSASWWNHQIIISAKKLRYFADLERYRRWTQIRLSILGSNLPKWNIVVSFHHKESRAGLMAAVVFLTTADAGWEEERSVVLGSVHEFTYSSSTRIADDDFLAWLDEAVKIALEAWQARL